MIKKSLILFLFCSILNNSFAQRHISIDYIESRLVTHQGVEFVGELKEVNNDLYAFENWNNYGIIFMNNNQYSLSNLNFNVTTNSFNSRIKRDQLFLYKNASIDSILINKRLFKKVENSFYEVLLEKDSNQFLKKYAIKYKAGSISRLDGSQAKPTTSLIYAYLLKINDEIKMIELTKKSILALFTNEESLNNFKNFVHNEKLSYKRENDIIKMIDFIFKTS